MQVRPLPVPPPSRVDAIAPPFATTIHVRLSHFRKLNRGDTPPARCAVSERVSLKSYQEQPRLAEVTGIKVDLGRTRMHRIGLTSCPYCGSSEIYASDTRTLWQRVPIVFLLRLVRCHVCMRRHYRPIIYPTPKPPLREGLRKKSHTASSEDSVRKNRSA
jgi:hypothetical protein